jgi:integrase
MSHDVRVWGLKKRRGQKGVTYQLRWVVAGKEKSASFATIALADSQRSVLLSAARRGEAFDIDTGLPVSCLPDDREMTWWEWALEYVDIKWSALAPRSRRSTAEALMTITLSLVSDTAKTSRPSDAKLRSAMFGWAFNATNRAAGQPPENHAAAISWLSRNTVRLSALEDPSVTRQVLKDLARKLDGKPVAATTFARKRAVFSNTLELAVERNLLEANPLEKIKWRAPRQDAAIDPRVVANPTQGRRLLAKVAEQPVSRAVAIKADEVDDTEIHPLLAFFAVMYYSALRPSEAVALTEPALLLPAGNSEWGQLRLTHSDAEVTLPWTDTREHSSRQLKHRAIGAVRPVPCPPPLGQILRQHLGRYGTAADGRLFRGPYGGRISASSYTTVWKAARTAALSETEAASPLVRTPYDLRHTAVSTWLAAGVDSAQVAAWAGHSVAVLHRIYVHVLPGREQAAHSKIAAILGLEAPTPLAPPAPPTDNARTDG